MCKKRIATRYKKGKEVITLQDEIINLLNQ
nr:MAG TPA: hypothetical protein [Bacteriophage sp.]